MDIRARFGVMPFPCFICDEQIQTVWWSRRRLFRRAAVTIDSTPILDHLADHPEYEEWHPD